ncbi:meiotic recombination protein REC8 homolog [Zophobas morio]|uniref:meiotic recombination protein REC8 homolog n=1 Tax=Zophobas morio TaxID=2755281 RepID=UPI003082A4B1
MFFNLILLNRQHQARFGYAWIAATLGIKRLARKDVLALDICKICDEIAQYVCSESDSPRSRFSLRLSAVLINGITKIYRQRAVYFMEDLVKFMTSISRPAVVVLHFSPEEGMFPTPPTPVPRKKGKKRRLPSEVSTPQSQIDRLVSSIVAKENTQVEAIVAPESLILQARADEVTLHEGQVQREATGDEFGMLGVLPTEEDLIRDISQLEEPRPQSFLALQPKEEFPEPSAATILPLTLSEEPPRKQPARVPTSTSSSEPEVAPVTITVEALIHAPADITIPPAGPPRVRGRRAPTQPSEIISEIVPVSEITQVPTEEVLAVPQEQRVSIELTERVRPRSVVVAMQEEAVTQRDKKIATRKEKIDKDLKKILISIKPRRMVRIDRCEPKEIEWIDINPCPLPQFKLKTPNTTNLLDMYLIGEPIDLQMRHKVSQGSLERSASLRRKSGRMTPPAELSGDGREVPPVAERVEESSLIPEIRISEVGQVPGEVLVSIVEEQVMIETPKVATESRVEVIPPLMASTPVRRKSTEIEQKTIEEVMAAPAEEHLLESPRKKRRLFLEVEAQPEDLDFITIPSEIISRELTSEAALFTQESFDSVPLPLLTTQKRQQEIVNKVFSRGRLTLEEICQRPINRLNIARAFNDILILCKHRYVTLIPEDDSSEFKFVERGSKMGH